MTASQVDGRAVIATERATSNITGHDGQPIRFKQILRLLLEDGTVLYGCAHCDFTGPSPNNVRPHLNRHRRSKAANDTIAELAAQLGTDRAELVRDRDEWKARARKAEGELARLRRIIQGAS
jgi:hypothetical protein